jgi:hypothetical protein
MDAAIKRLVSGRLRAHAAGPHPDPELLAAFSEQSLSRVDRERLLNHLTICADCRDVLYLAIPESETQQVLLPSRKSPRLAIRWATLAASVVVLGAVLLTDRGIFTSHSPNAEPSAKSVTGTEIAELKAPAVADRAAQAPAVDAKAKVHAPLKHMTAKPQGSMQFDQSGEVHFISPQSAAGANQAYAAHVDSLKADSQKKDASRVDWGLSPNGDVQRSFDSGKTWQIVSVADLPFRAISSLGNDVWVGGSAGALYHSANSGQSWTKAAPVSTADIVQINFYDSQNGQLNTANGQVWSTSDGGRSWRLK